MTRRSGGGMCDDDVPLNYLGRATSDGAPANIVMSQHSLTRFVGGGHVAYRGQGFGNSTSRRCDDAEVTRSDVGGRCSLELLRRVTSDGG